VDISEYMTVGAGRFVDAADFQFLNDFFNSGSLPPGTYTKDDIFKKRPASAEIRCLNLRISCGIMVASAEDRGHNHRI
jgi:hypothetical protein